MRAWNLSVQGVAMLATLMLAALPAAAQMQDRTLRVGSWDLPPAFGNPYNGLGTPSVFTWSAIFDQLTHVDVEGVAQPALAVSWRNVSPTVWQFELREGVRFHNGEPFDAAAVIATLDWLRTDEAKAKGPSGYSRTRFIEAARATGPLTVEITTAKPNPIVPNEMAVMMIVAPQAWRDLGVDGFAQSPAGTGAYRLVSWEDNRAALTAAEDAWQPPRIRNLEVFDLPERPARLQAFLSGQLDVMLGLTPDNLPQVEASGAKVDVTPGSQVLTWAITQVNGAEGVDLTPFRDKRVRQALNYAIDTEAMARDLLGNGLGGVATGQGVSRSAFGYNPDVRPYPYEPETARRLLAEAGYPTLKFAVEVVPGAFPADGEIFQLAAQDLGKVGVEVELRVITFADWLKKFYPVDWPTPVWHNLWASSPVMDATTAILNQSCGKGGEPYLCDETQQAMIDRANAEFDPAKRKAILHELIALQHEEAVNVFLIDYNNIHATQKNVDGFRNENQTIAYREMWFTD